MNKVKINSTRKGRRGEEAAAKRLEGMGYVILKNNYRCEHGEIDIIARKSGEIVFVEVKNWDYLSIDSLGQSINEKKQQRIIASAKNFLNEYPVYYNDRIRFDVIFFQNNESDILHINNAFIDMS